MPRHRRRVVALLTTSVVTAGTLGAGTSALFTDAESTPRATFTAGTLDLTASPRQQAWTVDNMAPGDEEFRVVSVGSAGTLPLEYEASVVMDSQADGKAVTNPISSTNDGLGEVLKFRYRGVVTQSGGCSSSTAPQVSETSRLTAGTAKAIDLGIPKRHLSAGSSEMLCFSLKLPIETDNRYQADSARLTLTFSGQQTDRSDAGDLATPE